MRVLQFRIMLWFRFSDTLTTSTFVYSHIYISLDMRTYQKYWFYCENVLHVVPLDGVWIVGFVIWFYSQFVLLVFWLVYWQLICRSVQQTLLSPYIHICMYIQKHFSVDYITFYVYMFSYICVRIFLSLASVASELLYLFAALLT